MNYLSQYLLLRLLLPAMHKAGAARVVHVSSLMHHWGTLDHAAYNSTARNADPATAWTSVNLYCDTKLMQVTLSNALDRRQKVLGKRVSSVAVHPGFVVSAIDRSLPPTLRKIVSKLRQLLVRSAEEGAVTTVTAATLPSLLGHGGIYLEDWCIMEECDAENGGVAPHASAQSPVEQEWLWRTSSEIVGIKDPYDHRFDVE